MVARDSAQNGLALRTSAQLFPAPDRRTPKAAPHLAPWQERRAKAMMTANLQSKLAVADVAQLCRLSLGHFVRAFRNTVGMAPYGWYLAARIDLSKGLLLSTALPLAQIALECGFVDQSHFTNTFVRHVGMPPGRWRRDGGAEHEASEE
jgi:AraC family transcriptional regulator